MNFISAKNNYLCRIKPKQMLIFGLIIVAILLIALLCIYNILIRKRNKVYNAFATVDVMLQRRFDLIPNLVACVKAYAEHELSVFSAVAELRSHTYESLTLPQKLSLDNEMNAAQSNFVLIGESYPDLKASENFMHLQRSLNETEEQLSAARRTYNAASTDYNSSIQTFPNFIVAAMFGFRKENLFAVTQAQREVQKINL